MKLLLKSCIPAERTISIGALEKAVWALRRGERLPPVEYQALGGGLFLITRGCARCTAAALVGRSTLDGVRTRAPRKRVAQFLGQEQRRGRGAFMNLPVAETA